MTIEQLQGHVLELVRLVDGLTKLISIPSYSRSEAIEIRSTINALKQALRTDFSPAERPAGVLPWDEFVPPASPEPEKPLAVSTGDEHLLAIKAAFAKVEEFNRKWAEQINNVSLSKLITFLGETINRP